MMGYLVIHLLNFDILIQFLQNRHTFEKPVKIYNQGEVSGVLHCICQTWLSPKPQGKLHEKKETFLNHQRKVPQIWCVHDLGKPFDSSDVDAAMFSQMHCVSCIEQPSQLFYCLFNGVPSVGDWLLAVPSSISCIPAYINQILNQGM